MSISQESCRQHHIRSNLCVLRWPNRAILRIFECFHDLVFFFLFSARAICRTQTTKMLYLSPIFYTLVYWAVFFTFFLFSQFGCAIPILFSYRIYIFASLKVYFPLFYFPSHIRYIFNFPRIVWFYFILRGLAYTSCYRLMLLQFSWIFSFILELRALCYGCFKKLHITTIATGKIDRDREKHGWEKSVMHKVRMMFRGHTRKHFIRNFFISPHLFQQSPCDEWMMEEGRGDHTSERARSL